MGGLIRHGAALLAVSCFLFGLALGYRLAAEHYKGRIALERQSLLETQTRHQQAAAAQVRAVEHQAAERLANISKHYQRALQDAKAQTTRLLADLHRARQLYIPVQSCPSSGDGLSTTAPAARFRDGETRAELSSQAARFLVGEAARADQITWQLAACQAVVRADRGQW